MSSYSLDSGTLLFKAHREDILIEEMCLADYQCFFACWVAIVTTMVESEATLNVLYCTDTRFRGFVDDALAYAGIENPAQRLTPANLTNLFFGEQGAEGEWSGGLLFLLHNQSPEIPTNAVKMVEQRKTAQSEPETDKPKVGFLGRVKLTVRGAWQVFCLKMLELQSL